MSEVERYCDTMDELFATEGWKELADQMQQDADQTLAALGRVDNWDTACRLQGRLALLAELLNLPGTVDEHPNWRRKSPVALEDLGQHALFRSVIGAVTAERPKQ